MLLPQGLQRAEALSLQTWEVWAGLSNIAAMHRYQHFTFLQSLKQEMNTDRPTSNSGLTTTDPEGREKWRGANAL